MIATSDWCPFCDAPRSGVLARAIDRGGRLSRAAVFASVAACYTSAPPPKDTTPPPPPNDTVVEQPTFAQPPDQSADTGSIDGIVADALSNNPHPHAVVWYQGPDGGQKQARADATGRFLIEKLAPGNYTVWTNNPGGNPRVQPPRRTVTVTANQSVNVTLNVQPYVPDRGPCCKPYGAPPARRRVV